MGQQYFPFLKIPPYLIMLKKEIRSLFKKKRTAITGPDRMKWDDLLLIHFQTIDIPFVDYVLSFYPVEENKEINSFILTDYLMFRNPGLKICYPRTQTDNNQMDAVICHPDSIFETNIYNIPEPTDKEIAPAPLLDIVLIPLLAFDLNGYRVGYGKGYYDRYLKNCRQDCLKIGLSYFEPVDGIEDTDEFDVPLDLCITPQQIYVF
jgi:5-formyltetrahydrofolate cyclo-ligase